MWEIEDSIAEQEELKRKQAEFDRACNVLVVTELQLMDVEEFVRNFEMKYYSHVGKYCIELHELKTKLARWRYQLNPLDKNLQELVDNSSIELETVHEKFELSKTHSEKTIIEDRNLISAYTNALNNIHPARAYNLSNRAKRELWCKRLREAFEQQNLNEILHIDKTFRISIDAVEDGDVASLLISVIRKIYRAAIETAQRGNRAALLRKSEYFQLADKLRKEDEQTFFQPIIDELVIHINQIKKELNEIETNQTLAIEFKPSIYPEGLKHLTENGEKVRSKSEVIIINMMYRLGIKYFYEQSLTGTVINGEKYPDFTIYNSNQQPILWEHLGMLQNDYYKYKWRDKLAWYEANGFTLGFNLFVSRDEIDGSIDSRKIGNIAKFIKTLI